MATIWKFRVMLDDVKQTLKIPRGSEILSLNIQDGHPHVWVHVPRPEVETAFYHLEWVGTGCKAPLTYEKFIGTQLFNDGDFVFHLFLVAIA